MVRTWLILLTVLVLFGLFLVTFGNGQQRTARISPDVEEVTYRELGTNWIALEKNRLGLRMYSPRSAISLVELYAPDSEYASTLYGNTRWLVKIDVGPKDWRTSFDTKEKAEAFIEFLLKEGQKDGER